jgi:hypothetical protein
MAWLKWVLASAALILIQLPYHLVLGLPCHLVAWVVWRLTRAIGRLPRSAMVAIPLAAGLAPIFEIGPLGSFYPVYLSILFPSYRGVERSDVLEALLSFGITLSLVFALIAWLLKPARDERAAQTNP